MPLGALALNQGSDEVKPGGREAQSPTQVSALSSLVKATLKLRTLFEGDMRQSAADSHGLMRGIYLSARSALASWSRAAAALLRRQVLGIGVARCRRPGQFDERHDPSTGTVELANDETLLLDVGQQTPRTAQRM